MSTNEDSDEALVGRYVRGEAAAFDQLYKRHELRVWRYLERNVRKQATSDELLQEVWFALARNAISLESATRFRTRLLTLAHDKMSATLKAHPAETEEDAGRPASVADSHEQLVKAIAQLPRDQREAYLLHAEAALSVGEIAEITESTIDAAQAAQRQARAKLRELLGLPDAAPGQDDANEVDTLYRRLSASDPARPGEYVRRKVQAYSAQQAAERAVRDSKAQATAAPAVAAPVAAPAPAAPRAAAPAPRAAAAAAPVQAKQGKSWMLPAIAAGAAVALVGVFAVPKLMNPHEPVSAGVPPPPPVAEPAPPQVAQSSAATVADPEPPAPAAAAVEPEPAPAPAQVAAAEPAPAPQVERPAPAHVAPPAPTPAAAPPAKVRVAAAVHPAPQSAPAPVPVVNNHVEANTRTAPPAAAPVAATHAMTPPVANNAAPAAAAGTAVPNTEVHQAPAPTPPPAPAPAAPIPEAAPAAAAAGSAAPPEAFYTAAAGGDMGTLQSAINSNIDVNARDAKGRTALNLAIDRGHVDVVKALLAHGATVTSPDGRGMTPIVAARLRGNFQIIQAVEHAQQDALRNKH
jgi:RNA polymerase sigma factor (sigma-70 family)